MKSHKPLDVEKLAQATGSAGATNDAQLQSVLDALPALVARIDDKLCFRFINSFFEDWFGIQRDETVGRHIREVIGEEAFDRIEGRAMAALRGNRARFEDTRICADGSERWLIIDYMPEIDEQGNVKGFFALGYDITDQKQSEKVLRELATEVSSSTGNAYFRDLVEHLAKTLNVAYVLVGELDTEKPGAVNVLAMSPGTAKPNTQLEMAGTPCQAVFDDKFCCCHSGVQHEFPSDLFIRELGAESYIGIPLRATNGEYLGILVVMDTQPVSDTKFVSSILEIFAVRAAAEIERLRSERALQNSEQRYEILTANIPGVVYQRVLKPDGRFEYPYVSQGIYDVYGLKPEEIVADAQRILDVIHPDDRERFYETVDESARTLQPWRLEFRAITTLGEEKWIRGSSTVRKLENGDVMWDGLLLDITAEKRAERNQKESEERFRRLSELSTEGIFIHRDGIIEDVNRAGAEMLGYKASELLGQHVFSITTRESAGSVETKMSAKSTDPYEVYLHRKDGSTLLARLRPSNITIDGQSRRCTSVLDITKQRKAEEARKVIEQRFKDYAESASDWFWEMDADLRFTYLSDQFTTLTGIPVEQVLGLQRGEAANIEPEGEHWRRHFEDLAAHRPFRDFRYTSINADGKQMHVSVNGNPVFSNGIFQGYRGTTSDITAQVVAENAVKASEQRFKDFAESASDWFWEMDEGLRFTYLSYQFTARTGLAVDRVLGRRRDEVTKFDPEDENWRQHLADLTAHRPFRDFCYVTKRDDGSVFHLSVSGVPVFQDGVFRGYRGTGTDITEQVLAQNTVQESQQKFKDFAESASDWFWEMDEDLQFTSLTGDYQLNAGLSTEKVLGRRRDELPSIDLEDPGWIRHLEDLKAHRPFRDFRYVTKRDDGTTIHISTSGTPVIRDGKFLGYRGTSTNITEQVLAQEALRESEQRFKDFAASTSDWFWEMDENLRFTSFSGDYLEKAGTPYKTALGRRRDELPGVDVNDPKWASHLATLESHRPFRDFRYALLREDGAILHISTSGVPIFENGRFLGYRGTGTNITEQVEAQEALSTSERRFKDFAASTSDWFWEMDENLRFTFLSGEHGIAGISHEKVLGRRRDEMPGFNASDTSWKAHMEDLEAHRPFRDFRYVSQRDDGSPIYISVSGSPIIEDGKFKGYRGTGTDITAQVEAENAVRESEEQYRVLVESAQDGVVTLRGNKVATCNKRGLELLGRSLEELIGSGPEELSPEKQPDGRNSAEKAQELFTAAYAGKPKTFEWVCLRGNGTPIELEASINRVTISDKPSLLILFRDISERKRTEAEMRLAASVFDNSVEGILVTDANATILRVNPAFTEITGFSAEEAIGNKPSMLRSERHPNSFYESMVKSLQKYGIWQGEVWNRRKNGEVHPVWQTITAVRNEVGKATQYISIFSDITEKKLSEERIQHLAHYDALTDLPNRLLFNDRFEHAINRARRHNMMVGLLFLDLDRFKIINDTQGHPAGDVLLQKMAERLTTIVREEDTVARLGGDEFTVILEEVSETDDVAQVATKILDSLSEPIRLELHDAIVTGSIGISIFPNDGDDIHTLLKNADTAMYQAKDLGRNRYQFYTKEMSEKANTRLALESALRVAIREQEFILFYQPQICLSTGTIVGAEALVRWRHPSMGLVAPSDFIPVAEDVGLVAPIGNWVLHEACQQLRQWQEENLPLPRIAVNLSGYELEHSDIVGNVQKVLSAAQIPAENLELEITESFIMSEPEKSIGVLDELQSLGVHLAIDDFGTGYSSLSYLKRFPIQKIKIDRSFVRDISEDKNDEAIVQAVIALGRSLDLKVVAEGVETEQQRQFLSNLECDEAQGYLFGKPVPAEQFALLVASLPKIHKTTH